VQVDEFHVSPMVNPPDGGLPYHEWIVEFGSLPVGTLHASVAGTLHATTLQGFIEKLDQSMRRRNPYYDDLVTGHVLQPLKIVEIRRGTFQKYLSSIGKLGGQNKVPHLADSREIADAILMLNSQ
jgi:hypothetical protein